MPRLCGMCGDPARGFADVDGVPYCHEGPSPTCYEAAQGQLASMSDVFAFLRELEGEQSEPAGGGAQ